MNPFQEELKTVRGRRFRPLPTNKQKNLEKNNDTPAPCSPLHRRGAGGEVRCTVKKPQKRLFNSFENRLNGKKTAVFSLETRQFPNNKMTTSTAAIKNSIIKKNLSSICLNFLLI